MKKFLLAIAAAAAIAPTAWGETVNVGYYEPGISVVGDVTCDEPDAWVSSAVKIPASTVRTMAGAKVTGVTAGIASKLNVDKIKVWIRTDLNGENLAEMEPETFKRGWNEVLFAEGWTIPADAGDLYVGYSYHQKSRAYGAGQISQKILPENYLQFGEKGEWQSANDRGTLLVSAIVEGDNLPAANVSVLNINMPKIYVIAEGKLEGKVLVKNFGTATLDNMRLVARHGGQDVGSVELQPGLAPGAVKEVPFTIGLDIPANPENEVTFAIEDLSSGDDADLEDNYFTATLRTMDKTVLRKALVEEFTTENCSNCPNAANGLASILHNEPYKSRVLTVCHHAGYYTDSFTTSFDEEYVWFYGGGSYAPGFMVDRTLSASSPVFSWSATMMKSRLDERLNEQALVSVEVYGDIDDKNPNRLKVTVQGAKFVEPLCSNPRITVFLVENDVPSLNQAGATSSWVHQHVGRAVNTTWGAPIEFNGDNYSYECQFTLDSKWKKDNLQVIALISNYDRLHQSGNNVYNCNDVTADMFNKKNPGSGLDCIGDIDEVDGEIEYYTVNGVRVNGENLAPGLYIRRQGNQATKILVR